MAGFENPPATAKPRVWWHWLDGNVSEQGIRKDLDWLNSVGIGGVHNFDASLSGVGPAPKITERVAYLTDEWRRLFRFVGGTRAAAWDGIHDRGFAWMERKRRTLGETRAGDEEARLERDLSSTAARDLPDACRVHRASPDPSRTSHSRRCLSRLKCRMPTTYADAAVVAYRAPWTEARKNPPKISSVEQRGDAVDAALLSDGDVANAFSLPFGDSKTSWIQVTYSKPERIQSVTISVARPAGGAPSDMATGAPVWLEASDDGKNFRRVVDVPRNGAPQQTLTFAPVTARIFRLVLERPTPQPSILELLGLPAGPPQTAHRFRVLICTPRRASIDSRTRRDLPIAQSPQLRTLAKSMRKRRSPRTTSSISPRNFDRTTLWTGSPPPGRWIVLRFGYSLTGRSNHPASREGTGLEVDKLNRKHVKSLCRRLSWQSTRVLSALTSLDARDCNTCSPTVTKRASRTGPTTSWSSSRSAAATTRGHGCRRWRAAW